MKRMQGRSKHTINHLVDKILDTRYPGILESVIRLLITLWKFQLRFHFRFRRTLQASGLFDKIWPDVGPRGLLYSRIHGGVVGWHGDEIGDSCDVYCCDGLDDDSCLIVAE